MSRRQYLIFGTAILALSLCFACGCTGQSGTDGYDSHASEELNIGYQPSTHQMAFMTAFAKDWYSEKLAPFGVTKVNDFQFPTGAPEMQAMLAGDLDAAYVGAAPFVTAVANGLDAKIVAAVQTQGSDIVINPDIEYNSPADLKGLKIATFPAGTIQDTLLRDWLRNNGVDPENDVEIVAMGPGPATTAITAGQVDAVFLPHPAPTNIEMEGAGKIVVQSGEMFPNHACCVLVVSGDMIRNQPEIVEELLRLHIQATDYNNENPEEAAQIMSKMTGMPENIVIKSLEEWDGNWVSDPNLIVESVTNYATVQSELGYISRPVTKDELFDLNLWDSVV